MLGKRTHAAAAMNVTVTPPDFGQAAPNSLPSIPRYVQYTSPVPFAPAPHDTSRSGGAATLPLNLIALIVSFLDDIGDIARVTRTSRLLYYMTLPQLYEHVDLHSYADIRYVNGRPEGFGSGSPFMMGLNGLVTKAHGALVKDFRVYGNWNESGVDAYAKGRVPDNSMMLNILLRAATDKMTKLQSFSWDLDCKPLKTLYQGLGAHSTLTSLTLRFPSTRIPRPSVLIPPMTNLRVFRALDIDPMCYPDDISMLMLHSKKLIDVRLHFSPRMRAENEGIMTLNMFFGRCHKAGYKIKLKHFAMHNFFGPNVLSMDQIFDTDTCESVTFLDTFGSRDPRTIFVDSTWENIPANTYTRFKAVRCNELAPQHLQILRDSTVKMERFYIVNEKRQKSGFTPSDISAESPITPSAETPTLDPGVVNLQKDYLDVLTQYHGAGLKHLLLSDQWAFDQEQLANLVRCCPNLEQLGIAVDNTHHNSLKLLMPFLQKLKCLRILHNEHLAEHLRIVTHAERMLDLGREFARNPPKQGNLIIFGEYCYKVAPGRCVEFTREDGTVEWISEVRMVDKKEAEEFEICRLDCLDLEVDPIAPFSP